MNVMEDARFLFKCSMKREIQSGTVVRSLYIFVIKKLFCYVHSLMSYKGPMCNNNSLFKIEDLGRSNNILHICTIIIK